MRTEHRILPILSGYCMHQISMRAGYNLPDWAAWGGDLAAYAWDPDSGNCSGAVESQPGSTSEDQEASAHGEGTSRPTPGTVAWSLMCAITGSLHPA